MDAYASEVRLQFKTIWRTSHCKSMGYTEELIFTYRYALFFKTRTSTSWLPIQSGPSALSLCRQQRVILAACSMFASMLGPDAHAASTHKPCVQHLRGWPTAPVPACRSQDAPRRAVMPPASASPSRVAYTVHAIPYLSPTCRSVGGPQRRAGRLARPREPPGCQVGRPWGSWRLAVGGTLQLQVLLVGMDSVVGTLTRPVGMMPSKAVA